MTDTSANFPAGDPVDGQGRLTPQWRSFFLALFSRTGGTGSPVDLTTLEQQMSTLASEIAALFADVNAIASASLISALAVRIAQTERLSAGSVSPIQRPQIDPPGIVPLSVPRVVLDLPHLVPAPAVMPSSPGTAGQVLMSTGPNSRPAFSSIPSQAGRLLAIRSLANGAYTPTAGTNSVLFMLQAPGGAGGGTAATSTGQSASASGGSAGAIARAYFTSGFSGVTVALGTPGAGVVGANGGAGTAASIGSLISCPGGPGGAVGAALSAPGFTGGSGATAAPTITGAAQTLLSEAGMGGYAGLVYSAGVLSQSGQGANSLLGQGGNPKPGNGSNAAIGYGAGGSGANAGASQAAQAGANGQIGYGEVWEFA